MKYEMDELRVKALECSCLVCSHGGASTKGVLAIAKAFEEYILDGTLKADDDQER